MISTAPITSAKHVYHRISKTRKHYKTHQKRKKSRHHKTVHRGGKWSRKYKLSINCNDPKGFSQRQYCNYGRNK